MIWRLDNLNDVGGNWVSIAGTPKVVHRDDGTVVEFNGSTDGILLFANPLAGLEKFTIEVIFRPAADGPEEQRFLHFEDDKTRSRVLLELRMLADGRWSLDTFLRSPQSSLTLFERRHHHPPSEWHVAALSYDGRTMTQYVNGVEEASAEMTFTPLGVGMTSIGVRQNQVAWFKGAIRLIRITPEALTVDRLLSPTSSVD
jgi:hypothetical protein